MSSLEQPALLPALITSGVGLFVFAGTQIVLHMREETKLLRERLEKLMLVLGDFADSNHQRVRHTFKLVEEAQSKKLVEYSDSNELTLHSVQVKLITLVDFYFPDLAEDARSVAEANRRVSDYILHCGESRFRSFSEDTFFALGGKVAEEVDVFRTRILTERLALIRTFRGRVQNWWINKCDGH